MRDFVKEFLNVKAVESGVSLNTIKAYAGDIKKGAIFFIIAVVLAILSFFTAFLLSIISLIFAIYAAYDAYKMVEI